MGGGSRTKTEETPPPPPPRGVTPKGCATVLGAVPPPPASLTQTQHLFVAHLRTHKQTKLTRRDVTGHSS